MKLYLVTQDDNNNYDTFDSFICAAESEEDARNIQPNFGEGEPFNPKPYGAWAKSKESVTAVEIGIPIEGTKRGIILASFNAG